LLCPINENSTVNALMIPMSPNITAGSSKLPIKYPFLSLWSKGPYFLVT